MEKLHPIIMALNELGQLEWWRAHMFFDEGPQPLPPLIASRFKEPEQGLVERIKEVVDSFQGNVAWRMMLPVPPRKNFVIATARVLDPLPSDYGKSYSQIEQELTMTNPSFGEAANRDVIALAARISELKSTAKMAG
jgi:hypothetical protein